VVRFADTRHGRVRGRVFGPLRDAPPVVTVMGMAVSDYLTPAQAALNWTQAHLVDLPGLAGSGDPPHRLGVPQSAEAVCDWLEAAKLPPVIIAGHSSGTQVAAHVAAARPDLVAATVLASPTVDPKARSVPRALYYWRRDSAYPMPGLDESHRPEWRAGVRQLVHLAEDGRLVTVPGPHTFLWRDPAVWSEPLRHLAAAARETT
jgi:pimeloyl-ACP methyl ester carboxylesterase